MALVNALRLIKFDKLTEEQRKELMEKLKVRQKELRAAMRAVDGGLEKLAKLAKK